jgi:hypothetical protein
MKVFDWDKVAPRERDLWLAEHFFGFNVEHVAPRTLNTYYDNGHVAPNSFPPVPCALLWMNLEGTRHDRYYTDFDRDDWTFVRGGPRKYVDPMPQWSSNDEFGDDTWDLLYFVEQNWDQRQQFEFSKRLGEVFGTLDPFRLLCRIQREPGAIGKAVYLVLTAEKTATVRDIGYE